MVIFIVGFLCLSGFNNTLLGQTTVYSQNFDGAHGWTLDGTSHFSVGAPVAGNTCTAPRSASKVLGTVLNGNYSDSWTEANSYAISPAFDCSAYNILVLSFYSYSVFENTWDSGYVYVSGDNGTSWTNVETFDGTETGWTLHTLDISNIAASKSQVRIKITMSSDVGTVYTGWNIDDLSVSAYPPVNYYSKSSGNLNTLSTWGTNTDGSGTAPANFTNDYQIFNIRNNAAPTISANWTVSGSGSRVIVGNGTDACTFTVSGTNRVFTADCSVSNNGVLKVSSTAGTPYSGSLTVNAGGTYEHAKNGGTIPTATWDAASNCNITGVTSTIPGGQAQTFGNFLYNCPDQTGSESFAPTQIAGNLQIISTGGNQLQLNQASLTVNGNCTINDEFRIARSSAQVLNILGSFTLSGGTLDMSSGSSTGALNVAGDFNISGGTLTESGNGSGSVTFNKTGTQTYSKIAGIISNRINFTVNSGSTLDVGTSIINGSTGIFTLSSGAGIITAHSQGLSTTAATGSIQVTGTKTYNTGANYTYDGTVNQVTGNGLPTTLSGNLTINNSGVSGSNTVSLSAATSVAGTLTLTNGLLSTTTTNLLSVTNTDAAAISGGSATSYINGPVRWTLPAGLASGSTYNFPVGDGTTYLPLSLVDPTTGTGTVTAQVEAFATNPGGTYNATLQGLSNTEYWSLTTAGNFTNSSLSLTRTTAISPFDVVGGSTSAAGTYTCLDGSSGTNSVSNSSAIGANRFFALAAKKQTITTITINGSPFCAGSTVNVPFTYDPKAKFAGSTFTAQLSSASGSFTSPVTLQSVASNGTGSQSLNVTIPGNTASGTGYRIRIVSTAPVVTGSDNGANLTISSAAPSQPGAITGSGSSPCANTAGLTYSVPNVSGVTYTWSFPSDWTQTGGGTTNSVTVTSGSASGNIQVTPSNACGDGTAQTLAVAVVASPTITVQPSTTPQSVCQNGATTAFSVSASGTGVTYQWYKNTSGTNSGGTLLSGATSSSYTPLSTTTGTLYYYCVVSGSCAPAATSDVSGAVTVIVPQALTPTPVSRCNAGTLNLSVTASSCASSTVSWFAASTGGPSLGTGTSFTTPYISSTTTYYAQENYYPIGLTSIGGSSSATNNMGLVFDLSEQIVLNSIQINASATGSITIALQDNAGNQISSVSPTLTSTGVQTINLGWTIPSGSGYRILKTAGTMALARTNPYTSWPVGFNVGSITSSIEGGTVNSTRYDFFYNWSISRVRVPVTATIGSPIVSGFSGSLCGPGTVALRASTSAGAINWYPALTGGSTVATGTSYYPNLSTTTTYYIDATDGSCISSPRIPVVASIITPPTVTAGGGGTYCSGSNVTLTSTGTYTNWYWTGPNNFYSLLANPVLTNVTPANSGIYTVTGSSLSGVNLVSNGDFQSGNIGFGSGYIYNSTSVWDEGTYAVVANPHSVHSNFVSDGDHTSGSGLQMVVNGASVANVNIWSQTVNVVPNTDYQYTYWIQSVVEGNPSQLQLYINGSPAGPVYTADVVVNSWRQFTYNWNSGSSTSAYLSLVNQNITPNGNDFALDDIVFQPACSTADNIPAGPIPDGNGNQWANYGVIVVTVNNDVTAGSIGTAQTICPGYTPATLTSTGAGTGSGTISYEWQTNASGSYITIPGATSATYSPPALTSTTSYQRRTVSLSGGQTCYSSYTPAVTITVTTGPTAVAGGPDNVCQSASPSPIALTGASVGGSATTGAWSIVSGGGSLSDYSQTTNPAAITYTPAENYSGTVKIRLTSNNTGCAAISDRTINITPTVGTPVFTLGAASTRCQGAGTVTYGATATNNTGITYTLDGASITGGNSIVAGTGAVTFVAGWGGTSTITASATGCNGPKTATHTVTITPTVGAPVFTLGATSTRCQGAGTVTYTATATNSTGITYTLDGASITGGNSIVAGTGAVTFVAGWSGTSTITASATGCNGPKTATHTVTITPTVGTPVFALGTTSTRCQGAGSVTYTATATNSTGITYTLDGASITGGNSIVAGTGAVTFVAGWGGTSTITASATGCNGPKTATHTVTITPLPVATFSYSGTPYCSNASNPSPTFSGGGVAGTFSSTAGLVFVSTATGQVNLAASTAGTYTVTNTIAAAGGCGVVTATSSITITALPTATVSYSGSPFCTNFGTGTVTFSGTTGGIYSSSPAGLSLNASSGAITTATSTPGTYTVTYTIAAANGCAIVTATTSPVIRLEGSWNGSVSTDWNTTGNWDCNQLPTLLTNVIIANSKTRYPNNSTGTADQAKDLTIQNNASVTVTGNTLEIAGAISNSGTFTATAGTIEMKGSATQSIPANTFTGNTIMDLNINNSSGVTLGGPLNITGIVNPINGTLNSGGNLTLVSTADQTALIAGTGNGQVSGNVLMQRYLASAYGYKYFSSPFSDATVGQFSGYLSSTATIPKFYRYDENHTNSGADMTGWTPYLSGTLNPMEGYTANFGLSGTSSPKTVVLNGSVNNGSLSATLYNHNRTYTQGFNLAGNPYPSPIDWDAASGWTRTNIDNAIYFFNATAGSDEYAGVYSSYVNGLSSGGSTNLIPSMQGFFVHVTGSSGTFGMNNNVRTTHLNPTTFKSASFKSASVEIRPILRFTAGFNEKNSIADPFVLYFDPSSTSNFDVNSDALKLMNTDLAVPNLYAITPDVRQLSISGMPLPTDSLTKIPLGVKTLMDGWVNFTAKEIALLPSSLNIYLNDAELKINQDLKKIPTYRFYLKAGEYNQRFMLLFAKTNGIVTPTLSDKLFAISRIDGTVVVKINLPDQGYGKLYVSNMLGQIILEKEVTHLQTVDISAGVKSGVYVVTVTSGERSQSEKTLIRKD